LKAIPSKAGKTKYAWKVLVFVHSMWFQSKIKLYKESEAKGGASPVYLIEFQRRCGDSLAFNSTYRAAEKYLQDKGFVEGRGGKGGERALLFLDPSMLGPPEQEPSASLRASHSCQEGETPEPALGPVLDLAKSNCLRYQAEGAIAIAERAEQKMAWTAELGAVLKELLEVQETIVAYPTVKALHNLAQSHKEARDMAVSCKEQLSKLSGRSSLVRKEMEQLVICCGK